MDKFAFMFKTKLTFSAETKLIELLGEPMPYKRLSQTELDQFDTLFVEEQYFLRYFKKSYLTYDPWLVKVPYEDRVSVSTIRSKRTTKYFSNISPWKEYLPHKISQDGQYRNLVRCSANFLSFIHDKNEVYWYDGTYGREIKIPEFNADWRVARNHKLHSRYSGLSREEIFISQVNKWIFVSEIWNEFGSSLCRKYKIPEPIFKNFALPLFTLNPEKIDVKSSIRCYFSVYKSISYPCLRIFWNCSGNLLNIAGNITISGSAENPKERKLLEKLTIFGNFTEEEKLRIGVMQVPNYVVVFMSHTSVTYKMEGIGNRLKYHWPSSRDNTFLDLCDIIDYQSI